VVCFEIYSSNKFQNTTTGGRFTGRWSYGHPVWAEYPEIGRDLAGRTEELKIASPFYNVATASIASAADKSKGIKAGEGPRDPFGDIELSAGEESDEEEDNNSIDKILKAKVKVNNSYVCIIIIIIRNRIVMWFIV
jgi:hypothetical protein